MKDKVVVIKFPIWSYTLDELKDQYKSIQDCLNEKGYDWDMILIPRDCDWIELSYEELTQIRDTINWLLEKKQNNI